MNWTDSIERIYCISLPKSHERRKDFLKEMAKHAIPVIIWPAIYDPIGAKGLKETYQEIFTNSLDNGFESILVFEDDAFFCVDNVNQIMDQAIDQLPKNWEVLYLGLNPWGGFSCFQSENLLKVKSEGYTTHAVMYSERGMKRIVEAIRKYSNLKIDEILAKHIQQEGNSYATYPLLCSQKSGWSYIEGKEVDYSGFIQQRFKDKVSQIK